MTIEQKEIHRVLAQLSHICPQMRFGQLVSNVAFWAKGPALEGTWDVGDGAFLEAAGRHFERRCEQLEVEPARVSESIPANRDLLFLAVQELGERYPERRFAELLAQVAEGVGITLYDIEDDDFLEAVRKHRERGLPLPSRP